MPTFHLTIKGKVQGVFYRATAKDVAKEKGIKGWVKNTKDDNVEAVISGTQQQTNEFIEWCRQGPRRAKVIDVEVNEIADEAFDEFKIIK